MRKRARIVLFAIATLLLLFLIFQSGRTFERLLPLIFPDKEQPVSPAALANPAMAPAAGALPLSPPERLFGLSAIWEAGRVNYPFWHRLPELDWDRAYQEFIPRVLQAEDDLAYYRVLEEFIALLQDGHTSIYLPKALTEKLDQPALRLLPAGGQLVVVSAGDELRTAGLLNGATLTAIDGRPTTAVASDLVRRLPASTEQDRQERVARKILEGPAGSTVALSFTFPDGTSRTFPATRTRGPVAPPSPALSVEDLGDGLFLVTIRTFADKAVVDQFNQAFPSFKGVKGLILDLRENGGGNTGHGDAIIRRMIRLPVRTSGWRTRQRSASLVANGLGERWYGLSPGR